jgi:hypothetical protein
MRECNRIFPKSIDPTGNPNDVRNVRTVVERCLQQGLVPTPNYKGAGSQEQFYYIVMLQQGFISDAVNDIGVGAHIANDLTISNTWGGGTSGGTCNMTSISWPQSIQKYGNGQQIIF